MHNVTNATWEVLSPATFFKSPFIPSKIDHCTSRAGPPLETRPNPAHNDFMPSPSPFSFPHFPGENLSCSSSKLCASSVAQLSSFSPLQKTGSSKRNKESKCLSCLKQNILRKEPKTVLLELAESRKMDNLSRDRITPPKTPPTPCIKQWDI